MQGTGVHPGQQQIHANHNSGPSMEQLQSQISHMNQMMIYMMNKKGNLTSPEDQIPPMAGMAYCLNACLPQLLSITWIIDSGAYNHICSNKQLLHSLNLLSTPFQVTLPNKQIVSIIHSGTVHLNPYITLYNVLYAPDFHCNLLSVLKVLQDSNCLVHFTPTKCIFQCQTQQRVLATGEHRDGLYLLTSPTDVHISSSVFKSPFISLAQGVPDVPDSKL